MFVCPECGEGFHGPGACPRDRAPLADAAGDPLLGQSVGPYRVACRIGAGGMGQVYKGVHPGIGSRVAIKVLAGDFTQHQVLVERFFAEARAVNVIRHESIVNVLDLAWLPDGRPYIVMEYLDGLPLSAVIRQRGPLPLGAVVTLMGEVLDALVAAHAHGVIHRDIKSDNIFVTRGGRAKVLDFGIAKLRPDLSVGSNATATGSILGTPQYMSPEQARGAAVDARTDIYSMGVILFQASTGRLPFEGDSIFDLLRQHIEAAPPRPRLLRPDLPLAFEQLVLRALEKDPARRFASAAELARALAGLAQTLPRDSFVSLGGGSSASSSSNAAFPRAGAGQFSGEASYTTGSGTGGQASHYTGTGAGAGVSQYTGSTTGGSYLTAQGASLLAARRRSPPWLWIALAGGGLLVLGALGVAGVVAATVGARLMEAESPAPHATSTTKSDREEDHPLQGSGPVEMAWQKPRGFDPKRLDVDVHLKQGASFARRSMPDAEPIIILIEGVNREGFIDLSLSNSSSSAIVARWRSRRLSERPADLPLGAKVKASCTYAYIVGDLGILAMKQDHMGCEEPVIPEPTCTVRQVLAKAEAAGAPRGNYVAQLIYNRSGSKGAQWYFKVGDFDRTIDDNCR